MSQANPTVSEIEVLARSNVKGMSHIDGFKAAYPKSKAKGHSLEQAAYLAYQNTEVHLSIESIRQDTKQLDRKDTIADVTECQESWTDIIRTGRERQPDGGLRDPSGVRAAAAELCKQRGDYDHNENEGVTVVLQQDIPGCSDE